MTRLLIVDLDNTLYDWVSYFAPAFRAMVHLLSDRSGVPEETLVDQFAELYAAYGTTEYPFTVQQLPALMKYREEEREQLARWARTAFSRSRIKSLRPYGDVRSTLDWASASGLTVAMVTNAPLYVVQSKLLALGLSRYISLVVAWEGFGPADDSVSSALRRRSKMSSFPQAIGLPRSALKPNPDALLTAIDRVGIPRENTGVVGDSLKSDMAPAIELGLPAYWARYGLDFSPKDRATIEQITPGGATSVARAYSVTPVPAGIHVLRSFGQLRQILEVPQASLF